MGHATETAGNAEDPGNEGHAELVSLDFVPVWLCGNAEDVCRSLSTPSACPRTVVVTWPLLSPQADDAAVTCFTLLFYFIVCVSPSVMSNSLRPHRLRSARLLCPWNSPGKNTGVGCHTLIQGIFPIQGLNPCILHCRQILYC